jgi:hypothetical protein
MDRGQGSEGMNRGQGSGQTGSSSVRDQDLEDISSQGRTSGGSSDRGNR